MTSSPEEPGRNRRRWLAFLLATVLMLVTYTMFLYGVVAAAGSETVYAGGLLGIALGLVPAVFLVAAFVSQRSSPLRAAVAATGLWFLVAIPIGLASLPLGLVAGFGAGGVFAFRVEPPHSWKTRAVAVAISAVYTLALQAVSPTFGLFGGAPLPFLAIVAADFYAERTRPGRDEPAP